MIAEKIYGPIGSWDVSKVYVFCDVNSAESLESSIKHACKNPNQYLCGPVFTKDASKHIKSFYDILITSIKNKLFL